MTLFKNEIIAILSRRKKHDPFWGQFRDVTVLFLDLTLIAKKSKKIIKVKVEIYITLTLFYFFLL